MTQTPPAAPQCSILEPVLSLSKLSLLLLSAGWGWHRPLPGEGSLGHAGQELQAGRDDLPGTGE